MDPIQRYRWILTSRLKCFVLNRVEQTQRELAASAASSQAVVRHLETEADSNQQLHIQVTQLRHQMETLRLQATQWKTAADLLDREKTHLKQT